LTNILFLTLKVFSATGGIEKVCRVAGKALYEMCLTGPVQTSILSMHDESEDAFDNIYFPSEIFKGYGARKINFIQAAVKKGRQADVVILSHINLLLVGWLIKKTSPKTRLMLFAHGIEIWGTQHNYRKKMLKSCDAFLCVSNYTKKNIEDNSAIPSAKCLVLNNCIDPYLPLPQAAKKDTALLHKYGYTANDTILFTLTRLSSKDRYKGYDKVFEALALLKDRFPTLRYLLGGGFDEIEKAYVDALVKKLQLTNVVTIAGYLPEEELATYFALADVYVMPSKKEGFGIVFIEAMYYGLPVIAGNADGSVDALLNGELGLLVNPESVEEIKEALEKMMTNKASFSPDRALLMENFSYEAYKRKLETVLEF
jgi:phosphatidyl-myo-inositol dimannoside synthase